MRFIDIEGKERDGKNFEIVEHENGIFIHAIIVGKTNEWPQFYPLKEFTEKNPRLFDGLGNLILER